MAARPTEPEKGFFVSLQVQMLKKVFVCKKCGKERDMPPRASTFQEYDVCLTQFEFTHKECEKKATP